MRLNSVGAKLSLVAPSQMNGMKTIVPVTPCRLAGVKEERFPNLHMPVGSVGTAVKHPFQATFRHRNGLSESHSQGHESNINDELTSKGQLCQFSIDGCWVSLSGFAGIYVPSHHTWHDGMLVNVVLALYCTCHNHEMLHHATLGRYNAAKIKATWLIFQAADTAMKECRTVRLGDIKMDLM